MSFLEKIGFLEPDFDHEWARRERARLRELDKRDEEQLRALAARRERAARAGCPCHACYEIRATLGIPQP